MRITSRRRRPRYSRGMERQPDIGAEQLGGWFSEGMEQVSPQRR
jgi:hypothetical protein